MDSKKLEKNIVQEIAALREQFDRIKADTEEFINSAKGLSERGVEDAKEMLGSAKANWNSIMTSFEKSPVAKFFSKANKKSAKKKTSSKASKKPSKKKAAKKSK